MYMRYADTSSTCSSRTRTIDTVKIVSIDSVLKLTLLTISM